MFGLFKINLPQNETVLSYAPGSEERREIKNALKSLGDERLEIPLIIGGKEIFTGRTEKCLCPHNHRKTLALYHTAGEEDVKNAIQCALEARCEWETYPWNERISIFMKAAELLSTGFRPILNAATMLGQSKTLYQAEIDAACELIDFLRFNAYYSQFIYQLQPESSRGIWNYMEYRPLDGFVFAASPFNFTSIAGNLVTAPAIMGNTVVWKPAGTAILSAYFIMKLLMKAGLPAGVINMLSGQGSLLGPKAIAHPALAGIHFTGNTLTFKDMWKRVGENIDSYRCYPRLVGETGGKDFIFAHKSAEVPTLVTAIIRGAFEYQGQKCSAASRAYLPESIWKEAKEQLIEGLREVKMGDVEDFTIFMGAVIDRNAFDRIKEYIDYAKSSEKAEIICGGVCDDREGYFIEPTIILTKDPRFATMEEEIFGPVLTIYVYGDDDYEEALSLCATTSPYALTGSIHATERKAILKAFDILRYSAGNFYINDKPTGAVVGQQPFGGSRSSGTNDKAGSIINLLRWVSSRAIKENFAPPTKVLYPYMEES